jgi:hypothetical protein
MSIFREHVDRQFVEPVLVLAEQFGDIGEQDVGGIGPLG